MTDTTTTSAYSAPDDLATIRKQAHRYLVARYGQDYVFRAPETFSNTLERWIWAVASDAPGVAEECMTAIEKFFADQRAADAIEDDDDA